MLAFSTASFAFTAPFPNKTQQKQLATQIRKEVRSQPFWKQLQGRKRIDVSIGPATALPPSFIGSGFPVATATVYAGKSMYHPKQLQPQKQRQYKVVKNATTGTFQALPTSTWHQLYTVLHTK
jgi:hypothetical protein